MPEVQARHHFSRLAPVELERLLLVAGAAQGFLGHDLTNTLFALSSNSALLQSILADNNINTHELQEVASEIDSVVKETERVLRRIALISTDWSFISSPSEIVDSVAKDLAVGDKLRVMNPPEAAQRIVFPRNALYTILFELTRNAVAHSGGLEVVLEWSIHSNKIFVSVHDTGTKLSNILTERFLVLDRSHKSLQKKAGGLSVVERVSHCAGGLVLARRSSLLGGAEISAQIPVHPYSDE